MKFWEGKRCGHLWKPKQQNWTRKRSKIDFLRRKILWIENEKETRKSSKFFCGKILSEIYEITWLWGNVLVKKDFSGKKSTGRNALWLFTDNILHSSPNDILHKFFSSLFNSGKKNFVLSFRRGHKKSNAKKHCRNTSKSIFTFRFYEWVQTCANKFRSASACVCGCEVKFASFIKESREEKKTWSFARFGSFISRNNCCFTTTPAFTAHMFHINRSRLFFILSRALSFQKAESD